LPLSLLSALGPRLARAFSQSITPRCRHLSSQQSSCQPFQPSSSRQNPSTIAVPVGLSPAVLRSASRRLSSRPALTRPWPSRLPIHIHAGRNALSTRRPLETARPDLHLLICNPRSFESPTSRRQWRRLLLAGLHNTIAKDSRVQALPARRHHPIPSACLPRGSRAPFSSSQPGILCGSRPDKSLPRTTSSTHCAAL
jgi:hypothetical protein